MPPKKGSTTKSKAPKKDDTDDFGTQESQAQNAAEKPPPPPMPSSFDYEEPEREIVKPDNQLPLTEEELSEEVVRMLQAKNPKAPKNIVSYNFREKCYKTLPLVDQMTTHYAYDGYLLHKSSDDAKAQIGTGTTTRMRYLLTLRE